jgi:hypothetical protein
MDTMTEANLNRKPSKLRRVALFLPLAAGLVLVVVNLRSIYFWIEALFV